MHMIIGFVERSHPLFPYHSHVIHVRRRIARGDNVLRMFAVREWLMVEFSNISVSTTAVALYLPPAIILTVG